MKVLERDFKRFFYLLIYLFGVFNKIYFTSNSLKMKMFYAQRKIKLIIKGKEYFYYLGENVIKNLMLNQLQQILTKNK